MKIRPESKSDHGAIETVLNSAFPADDESRLVDELRKDGDLAIALVAEQGGKIIGYIALSPMLAPTMAPMRILGLGPVAVLPEQQNKGVGGKLIRRAIEIARRQGYQAIFLLGHKEYYPRFGFRAELAQGFHSPYAGPNFMALELDPGCLSDKGHKIDYANAFSRV